MEWDKVFNAVDNTNKVVGGAPHRDLSIKVKMLFLQHLYNLSDPELEDQINDRLSFQKFAGINYTTTVADFTTIWRFKKALVQEGLMDGLFALILTSLESKGELASKT